MNTLFKLSTLTLALTTTAYAAETIPTYVGDEIVVTATRTPKPVREQLNDISVITQEQIAQAGAVTLAELLRTQPGIEFTSNGGMGTSSNIFIRGANSNHTLVLVDGMRISSATTGSTALEKIPLAQIERIEILRGPGSHLYGSEAIGGVIQVFTRSGKDAPTFNASAGIGSDNLHSLSAGAQGKTGNTQLNLQVDHLSTTGFSALANPANSNYNPDDDGYKRTSLTGRLAHAISVDDEIGVTAFYSKNATQYDGSTNKSFDSRNEQNLAAYSVYSRNRFLPEWQSLLRLGTSSDKLLTAGTTSWSQIRTTQHQALWQNDITTRAGLFTLGTERVEQRVRSSTTNFVIDKRDIQSYFAGYQGKFDAHSVQLNVRSDRNSQYGSHTTKSLAYGYQISPEWRASGSVGTAFSAPTFNQLYYPISGNPNLQPETALNKEVSVHYDQGTNHISWVHFENRVSNLISYVSSTYLQTQNARISGDTIDYHGKFGEYGLRASLTYQEAIDDASGLWLTRRAREYASLGIDRQFGQWSAGGEAIISGARSDFDILRNRVRLGGYTLLNLSTNYHYSKDVSVLARLNNVLDKRYELAFDYGTPGRNVFVGLNYQPR